MVVQENTRSLSEHNAGTQGCGAQPLTHCFLHWSAIISLSCFSLLGHMKKWFDCGIHFAFLREKLLRVPILGEVNETLLSGHILLPIIFYE